ncbi:PBSX family phage terminase large subunit (plasmid) [Rhodovastum atsumiense]|uniref:PBSX family phage terminase large subunit n=1 Tax=Rhodovastum atsumiense TaxID=504468 RepID=A0A5M6IVJ2_9PROT|nr:PBSX family phage terminase large subunit [Rhodovastum atsumiense]KAA5611867.1 PBSX family phage terminase large subunit [Rhodovastum atsumiense]CAH2606155.1 PBSX family phage terminase large subunit [Rhodovastum atsumiense]
MGTAAAIEFPAKLDFLFEPAPFKVLHGGRGSSKSWSVARALLILGAQRPLRILCAREYQTSIKESVHKLLSDQIEMLGLRHLYTVQEKTIFGANGTEFIFAGMHLNSNKIRSTEGVNITWVEEAQVVSKESWEALLPTVMRRDGSEIWITFNPDLETDETYKQFVLSPPPGAIVQQVNYYDNPWFPKRLLPLVEHLKATDLDAYANVYLGECRKNVVGALWTKEMLAYLREPAVEDIAAREAMRARMARIVVAVDPSGCSGPDDKRSDEIGIVVVGLGRDGIAVVLEDLSGRFSPDGWAKRALDAFDAWRADRIVAEKNFGGAMVESTIQTARRNAPVKLVTASHGKLQRAEPIAALYEQKKVHHAGAFPDLEQQLCHFSTAGYQGKRSPDHADACIWGLTELMLGDSTYDTSMNWV